MNENLLNHLKESTGFKLKLVFGLLGFLAVLVFTLEGRGFQFEFDNTWPMLFGGYGLFLSLHSYAIYIVRIANRKSLLLTEAGDENVIATKTDRFLVMLGDICFAVGGALSSVYLVLLFTLTLVG